MKISGIETETFSTPRSAQEFRRQTVAHKQKWEHVAHPVFAGVAEAVLDGRRLSPKELRGFGIGASDGLEALYVAGGAVFPRKELERFNSDYVESAARRVIGDKDSPKPYCIQPSSGISRWMDSVIWSEGQMMGVVGHDNHPRLRQRVEELKKAEQKRIEQIHAKIKEQYDVLVAAGKAEPL